MLDLNKNLFELDPDEVTAVYSPFFLWTMIGQQDRLECLVRVIRNINPCVMIVTETEVNHNSPIFVNRSLKRFSSLVHILIALEIPCNLMIQSDSLQNPCLVMVYTI